MPLKKENLSIMKKASKTIERTPTGIPGFDELVQGGFPKNSSILVVGAPGTGKTIFTVQYLVNGIEKYNEKGLFVTFEQKSDAIRSQAMQFGWNLEKYEKENKLKILSISIDSISDKIINDIRIIVAKERIKRVVIDSLSTLVVNAPIQTRLSDISIKEMLDDKIILTQPILGDYIIKRFVYNFVNNIRSLDCTTLLIGETGGQEGFITRDTVSSFVCDGVVLITFEALGGEFSRSLIVKKMRHTKNNEDVHALEISNKGLVVHKIN